MKYMKSLLANILFIVFCGASNQNNPTAVWLRWTGMHNKKMISTELVMCLSGVVLDCADVCVCGQWVTPQLPRPSSAERWSDFSFTNSLATSSLLRCERMRRTVRPVSSMWMRLPSGSQTAALLRDASSFSWSTAMPTVRSSRAKQ